MRTAVRMLPLALALLFAWPGNGLQEFYGAEPMPVSGGWPGGLAGLVNSGVRIAGTVDTADCWAYYAGDTATLNEFLAACSEVPDAGLRVVLHPGRRTLDMKRHDNTERVIGIDWMLHVAENYPSRSNAASFEGRRVLTTVDVWLGGQINLKTLDVLAAVEVQSDGELERFVERHRDKRQQASQESADKAPGGEVQRLTLRGLHGWDAGGRIGFYSFAKGQLEPPIRDGDRVDVVYYFDDDDCPQGALMGHDDHGGYLFPVGHKTWDELSGLRPPSEGAESVEAIAPLTKDKEGLAFWVKTGDGNYVLARIAEVKAASYAEVSSGGKAHVVLEWARVQME